MGPLIRAAVLAAVLSAASAEAQAPGCETKLRDALAGVLPHVPETVYAKGPPTFLPPGCDAACLKRMRADRVAAAEAKDSALQTARIRAIETLKECGE